RRTGNDCAVVASGRCLRRAGAAVKVPRRVSIRRGRSLPADVSPASPMAALTLALLGHGGRGDDIPARHRVECAAWVGIVRISGRQAAAAGYRPAGAIGYARRTGSLSVALVMVAAACLPWQDIPQGACRRSPLVFWLPRDRPDFRLCCGFLGWRPCPASLGCARISDAVPAAGERNCRDPRDTNPLCSWLAGRVNCVAGPGARGRHDNELLPLAHDGRATRQGRSVSAPGERRLEGLCG